MNGLFRTGKTEDLNVRYEDYMEGNWTVERNLSREEVFNSISPELEDLVEKIKIKKTLGILPGKCLDPEV